jgi:DNA processing protein
MKSNKLTLEQTNFPKVLRTIPDPPAKLYYAGPLLELLQNPRLAIVGSRKVSPYGKRVASHRGLAQRILDNSGALVSGMPLTVSTS